MATRTFRGTTNANWNTAGNWLELAVPLATDDVVFDASSPDCIVNISGLAKSITFTSYTNTITMTFGLMISGNLTLGSGMTILGTGSLTFNVNTFTWTFNGVTWPTTINITGQSTAITLSSNTTITHIQSTVTIAIGSAILYILGDISVTKMTGSIYYTGSGNWSGWLSGLTINTSGTINFLSDVKISQEFVYTQGTIVDNGYNLVILDDQTIGHRPVLSIGGWEWENISFSNTSNIGTSDIHLKEDLRCINLSWDSGGAVILNYTGYDCGFYITGNITGNSLALSRGFVADLSNGITICGTGTISGLAGLSGLIIIDTLGILTIDTLYLTLLQRSVTPFTTYYPTLRYVSGTVSFTGSETITVYTNNTVLDLNNLVINNLYLNNIYTPGVFLASNIQISGLLSNTTYSAYQLISSDIPGTQRLLTLLPGGTQDLRYMWISDIDSSGGEIVMPFRAFLHNTKNWLDCSIRDIADRSAF